MRKIIILGASGLIGSTVTRYLKNQDDVEVHAASRNCTALAFANGHDCDMSYQSLNKLMNVVKPEYVINCIGLTKHLAGAMSDSYLFPNVIVPQYLKRLEKSCGYSLIHISSDCVYSGSNAPYSDMDQPDALDNYGITKAISESLLEKNAMVLRTSTVGHELSSTHGLLEWFLSQLGSIEGYKNAYFNGVTTLTLAKLIYKLITTKEGFQTGIYNVAGERISKYDYLCLIQKIYQKQIEIIPNETVNIDRSLIQSNHINDNYSHIDWKMQLIQMKEEFNDGFNR